MCVHGCDNVTSISPQALRWLGAKPPSGGFCIFGVRAGQTPVTSRLSEKIELSVPSGGFEGNEVRHLPLTFGRVKSVRRTPVAMYVSLHGAITIGTD